MHPFRFAVQVSGANSGPRWRDLARQIEDLGYSALFMPDHLDEQWSPLVALTVAAEVTTTVRIGTLVLGNDYRHPVVLAREAATLELLSEGRLELGLGAGWMTSDYEQAGIDLDPPAVLIDRLGEAVTIVKELWREGSCHYLGDHYRPNGVSGYPAPRSGPALLIGGGSRRVLTLAGREADIVGVNPRLTAGFIGPEMIASALPEAYDQRLAWVREGAGDRFEELELQCLTFLVRVVDNGRQLVEELAPAFQMTVDQAADAPVALIGTVDEIVGTLQARRRRWGLSYWVVHQAELEDFAPVVARLAGT